MPSPTLILASTSRYRHRLLERLGLPFLAVAPDVSEEVVEGEAPAQRALRLARRKAEAIATQHPSAVVIGSDQVASLETHGGTRLLRKPGDRASCRDQLSSLSGRTARFDTAVAVRQGAHELFHNEPTQVQFRVLSTAQIERYLDREPAFDCAGGFKCEGLGVTLFCALESRDPTALVGLPLIWTCDALRRFGVEV